MLRTSFALLALAAAGSLAAAPSSPDPRTLAIPVGELTRARELVRQLGSEAYPDREEAQTELAKMGRLARPALLEAVNADPNPEIRSRCSTLLPKASAEEMKARLDVFLADADGKFEHDLPGWNEFRAAVRNEWVLLGHPVWSDNSLDKPAREVFADLISTPANRAVVMAVGGSANDLGQVVGARRQELYNAKYGRVVAGGRVVVSTTARREPSAADVATLLFAESQVASKFVPRTSPISTLITASGYAATIQTTDPKGKVYRAVAAAWLDTRLDPVDMSQAMTVANTLGLPDHACRIAVRLLTTPGAQVFYRGNAAATLARLGNKRHIPLLEKVIADNAVLTTIRKAVVKGGGLPNNIEAHEIQVRDVALAVCIILSGQKLDDYGFVDQHPGGGASYTYTRCYFPDEAARKAAMDKWKDWRANNP